MIYISIKIVITRSSNVSIQSSMAGSTINRFSS